MSFVLVLIQTCLFNRTPEEMVVMRRNLRKVNITRSPGGTPLVSQRNNENGTGLTPMMTKALRKKFQVLIRTIGSSGWLKKAHYLARFNTKSLFFTGLNVV